MTCYFRHLRDVFDQAGIEVTKENKRDLDKAIHAHMGVEYKNYSATWKAVKNSLAEDEEAFLGVLRETLG